MVPFRLVPLSGVPIAEQVAFAAKKAIFSRKLRPGDAFPSVRALARAMKIHANTAQKVIAQLAAEGLLEVLPGIGTVVARQAAPRSGRARLLAREVEQLAVQAMQIGASLEELQSAINECWRGLAGARSDRGAV
ncbi:MAG: GntR family transcriptional regulator [Candidatus Solibacter usitatus]|nr:GntR family transcriptional regulator [Candidatus Solibacter usitatus]